MDKREKNYRRLATKMLCSKNVKKILLFCAMLASATGSTTTSTNAAVATYGTTSAAAGHGEREDKRTSASTTQSQTSPRLTPVTTATGCKCRILSSVAPLRATLRGGSTLLLWLSYSTCSTACT